MPKEIDLTKRKKMPPPTPEQLQAVTSGGSHMSTPPPAKPVPGVTGTIPLPVGQPIKIQSSYTEKERQALRQAGVSETQAIPGNMADILAQASQMAVRDATVDLPLPVDPRTLPLKANTINTSTMTPEQRALVNKNVQEALALEQRRHDEAVEQQRQAQLPESVQTALGLAQSITNRTQSSFDVVDDRATTKNSPAATVAPSSEPGSDEAVGIKPSETGANVVTHCPHCEWPMDIPDIPEPEYVEKMSFLQSILGQKNYNKEYPLFGGVIKVIFRTLTTQEIDTVYKQVYRERVLGQLPTEPDFWERINRLRLYLQLQTIKSSEFLHDLPDGLSVETNPHATSHWKFDNLPPEETVLPYIEAHILEAVLPTESLNRIVTQTCNRFNRLVAKMEALVDNSDFWQKTEGPS